MTEHSSNPRPPERPARLQDTVRLSAEGLAKVLGDLEARVMRVVWRMEHPVSARAVQNIRNSAPASFRFGRFMHRVHKRRYLQP